MSLVTTDVKGANLLVKTTCRVKAVPENTWLKTDICCCVAADVKGANLLVETTGRVKLTDFGMAKQMVEDASFTKSFKGSAFWMVSVCF